MGKSDVSWRVNESSGGVCMEMRVCWRYELPMEAPDEGEAKREMGLHITCVNALQVMMTVMTAYVMVGIGRSEGRSNDVDRGQRYSPCRR